jgi:hypothetical protein
VHASVVWVSSIGPRPPKDVVVLSLPPQRSKILRFLRARSPTFTHTHRHHVTNSYQLSGKHFAFPQPAAYSGDPTTLSAGDNASLDQGGTFALRTIPKHNTSFYFIRLKVFVSTDSR